MEAFLQQQFSLLLQEATGNFVERAVYRSGGPAQALDALRADPDGEGVWLGDFVTAFFDEHLLDTADGAAFVLAALARRPVPADPGGPAGEVLGRLARAAFADVLAGQAAQHLQRQLAFS